MATWCPRIKSRALEAAPGKHEGTQPNLLLRRANRTLYAAQCLAAEANFAMPATSPTTWPKGTQVLNARSLLLTRVAWRYPQQRWLSTAARTAHSSSRCSQRLAIVHTSTLAIHSGTHLPPDTTVLRHNIW